MVEVTIAAIGTCTRGIPTIADHMREVLMSEATEQTWLAPSMNKLLAEQW